MRPVDIIKGTIVDVSENGDLTIKAKYGDMGTLIKRDYKECIIQLQDSRRLSDKQRRSCYALLREISDFTGMTIETSKEWLKLKFIADELQSTMDTFSLSDASMSLICQFQRFLIGLILEFDIPCNIPLLDYVDDIGDYIYRCLATKHCCICGQESHPYMHNGKALPLCDKHEAELEEMSFEKFIEAYHITDGVVMDKHLMKIYLREES